MTLQHNYSYEGTLQDSLKVNWRVEDLIGGDKKLDSAGRSCPMRWRA